LKLENNADYKNLSPAAQEKAMSEARVEMVKNLGKILDLEITGGESLSSVFYRYSKDIFTGWQEKFGSGFAIAWGIAMFVILKGFGTIFFAVAALVSFVIYELLLAFNVIHVRGENKSQETVDYS
jgi:hypothetical protein